MSKKMNRFLALLLVVVLTFSLSSSVFASSNTEGNVTVKVAYQGDVYINETVAIADLESLLATRETKHLYETYPFANYETDGVKDATVADALIYGVNKYYQELNPNNYQWIEAYYDTEYTTTYVPNDDYELSYAWDTNYYTYDGVTKIPGIYFLYFEDRYTTDESYTTNADGTTTYRGKVWTLTVNGVESDYASSVAIKANDVVMMNYDYVTFTY